MTYSKLGCQLHFLKLNRLTTLHNGKTNIAKKGCRVRLDNNGGIKYIEITVNWSPQCMILRRTVVPGVEGADNNDYALVIRRWKNRGHDRSMNSAPPCRRQSTNFVDFVNNFKAGITPF